MDGNIGWVAAGLMPQRHWSGTLPVPGTGAYEWNGFLPFDSLPMTYNPPSGFVATANDNILPSGYRHPLNYEWATPYRGQRVRDVLAAGTGFTVQSFQRLQHDDLSLPASQLVPLLVSAAARRGVAARADVQRPARWDFRMSRDAIQPVWFRAWVAALGDQVFDPRIPAAARVAIDERWDLPTLIGLMRTPDAAFGPSPAAARDSVMLAALDTAAARVLKAYGSDSTAWRWGALHQASFPHPLSKAFDLPSVSRGGDGNTVNASPGPGTRQTSGASFREIIDLADWDRSVVTSAGAERAAGEPALWRLAGAVGERRVLPTGIQQESRRAGDGARAGPSAREIKEAVSCTLYAVSRTFAAAASRQPPAASRHPAARRLPSTVYRLSMSRLRSLTLTAGLFLVACTKGVTTEPKVDLTAAFNRQESVWNSQTITNYTMEQERLCFCAEMKKVRLTVRDGAITEAVYLDTGDLVPPGIRAMYYTVPELFTLMRAQYAANPYIMEVLWDATKGYPAQIQVDPRKEIADDEFVINSSNVVKLTAMR